MLYKNLKRIFLTANNNIRHTCNTMDSAQKPYRLICFKYWTTEMVMEIICSAMNLKQQYGSTHNKKLNLLYGSKIMLLQEINEPFLGMALSRAASFLGADDKSIMDAILWEQDYNGLLFSAMSDAIFVSTKTHGCVLRFSEHATVPVMCVRSRTHAVLQSLATCMAIFEEFGTMNQLTVAYLGKCHPLLNSLLLLCPMLQANIKYKNSCSKIKVSPLMHDTSKKMCKEHNTTMSQIESKEELLKKAHVIQVGPKSENPEFHLNLSDIEKHADCKWLFFHTCPRGQEVDDDLFFHHRARTFNAYNNMQYIAAALMARSIKNIVF